MKLTSLKPYSQSMKIRGLVAAVAIVALGGLVAFLPGDAVSGGLYDGGHWEYVPTSYSASVPNDCPQGFDCWELCQVSANGSFGTGILCCVDSFGVCHDDLR